MFAEHNLEYIFTILTEYWCENSISFTENSKLNRDMAISVLKTIPCKERFWNVYDDTNCQQIS